MKKHKKTNMYPGVKTWNSFKGCRFDCNYCQFTFKAQAKRQLYNCRQCYYYAPHEHPERLQAGNIPNAKTIFVAGNGDLAFARPEYRNKIIDVVNQHAVKHPETEYYFQSKSPVCFKEHLEFFNSQVILVTTLETNRDEGYEKISKAPVPSLRYQQFKDLDYSRKVVTMEPVLDFDAEEFADWIIEINPEYVWLGMNSRPKQVQLPEPSEEKLQQFTGILHNAGIEVRGKDLRDLDLPHVTKIVILNKN